MPNTTRTIDWPATVSSIQTALNGPPALTQAEIASGVVVRTAIDGTPPGTSPGAGPNYDAVSVDGIANQSPYAASVVAWAAVMQPAWVEMDRVARAVYKLLATSAPSTVTLAAFGMSGLPTWQPNTNYTVAYVVPPAPTGYTYGLQTPGKSGSTSPVFSTIPGKTFTDGSAVWVCIAPITGTSGQQPSPVPWDITFQTAYTLTIRALEAGSMAGPSPGLFALVTNTFTAFQNAFNSRPSPSLSQDTNSTAAINALQTAIANANAWLAALAVT